jgi:16S rRNA (adenine1518-N6/adenine1519-N6)-dimethyltransferase
VARPKLGQHFLAAQSVLERIAAAACPRREDLVVEIGPGRGALTRKLLGRAARVVAVELDPRLAQELRRSFAGESRLEIVEADVLSLDLARFGPAVVAGNLPYYIASPILDRVARLSPPRAVFLIQKEVALRLTAHPGERDYGFLTVRTAIFAGVRRLFDVKPASFRPPPKVDSSVVLLEPHSRPLAVADPDALVAFVGQCFRHKRKTIRNNLAPGCGAAVNTWPEAASRAEQLSLPQFLSMYERLSQSQ